MVTFIAHRCNSLAKLNLGVSALKKVQSCAWVALSQDQRNLFFEIFKTHPTTPAPP